MKSDQCDRSLPLTLIIPTYCRPKFLKRLLAYFTKERAFFSIFVIDSSPSPYKDENQKITEAAAKYLQVRWFHSSWHFPAGVDPIVHEKIKWALSMIQTAYVVMCADDDLLVPSSIVKCVDFLEENSSFSCARGHIYDFIVGDAGAKTEIRPMVPVPSIESNDPIERLWIASRYFQQTFYAVFRTSVLREIEERLPLRLQRIPSWVDELAITTLSAVFGKVARLNCAYEYRQLHLGNYGHKVSRWPEMLVESKQRPFIDDYLQTIESALRDLCPSLSHEDVELAAHSSLVAFSKFYFDARYRDSQSTAMGIEKQARGLRRGFMERILYKLISLLDFGSNGVFRLRAGFLKETRSILQSVTGNDASR